MFSSAYYATQLRHELNLRNRVFAAQHKLAHVESYGSMRVVVYVPDVEVARHGNFLAESYAAITSDPEWNKRLGKVHAQARRSFPQSESGWKKLDSCTSSDALLMNVFCYPGVAESRDVAWLLGVEGGLRPVFGLRARVPLTSGLSDRTEVDLRLGNLLVEAKLTESDFQNKDVEVVRGYRDFSKTFEARLLPKFGGKYRSYQLIRNVLAAQANGFSFCVLLDARRPDLLESWYAVMRAVRVAELRVRCKVLAWQELSEALPQPLRRFLDSKYGIVAPGETAHPATGGGADE